MKKKYDSPAVVVLTINPVTLLSGSGLSSDGNSLKLTSGDVQSVDATNAASRSTYRFDE